MTFTLSSILGSGGAAGEEEKEFNKYAIFAGRNPYHSSGYYYNANATATGAEHFQILNGSAVNYTLPSGISKIRITVVGSGGSGGTRNGSHYHGGGGGGGGAFACAEYTVSGGETLSVLAANSASEATSSGHQYNGNQSYVTSGSIINISANGGTGGQGYNKGGGATTKQASGSALISGTSILANGGSGGQGSSLSFGFGPEPYGAGGGGAAGFVLGNGGAGGDNNAGGYSTNSSGGGAVGGKNGGSWGHGGVSTNNNQYASGSGAGGGANGGAGQQSNNPVAGGSGIVSSDGGGSYSAFSSNFNTGDHAKGAGKNASIRIGGGASGNALLDTGGSSGGGGGGPKVYAWPLMAVAHQGGGGGGSGYSSYSYSYPGGDAGPGGGGGGGGCYNHNSWGSHQNNNGYCYFDYAEGTHRMSDAGYAYQPMAYNARGGHGGVFGGGGGGGGYYGDGGGAGFGGGGGGGGGNFGSNVHGWGGLSGPGLVLIEWKE